MKFNLHLTSVALGAVSGIAVGGIGGVLLARRFYKKELSKAVDSVETLDDDELEPEAAAKVQAITYALEDRLDGEDPPRVGKNTWAGYLKETVESLSVSGSNPVGDDLNLRPIQI